MHDDLIDAVEWAKDEKIADPDKVAIMGGSYGGYATLVGLTFTPEVFTCGVDIVGPSNLQTLLSHDSAVLGAGHGDVQEPRRRSHQRRRPGAAQGTLAADVRRQDSKAAVDRPGGQRPAREAGRGRPDRRAPCRTRRFRSPTCCFRTKGTASRDRRIGLAFFAVAEAFLAEQLGGRYEPIGKAFAGSTITCPEGASQVPGLAEAMASHEQQQADEPAAEEAASGAE